MAKERTPEAKATRPETLTDGWKSITEVQAQGLRALTGMNTAWYEALSDMGSEVMSFVAERIKEDVKTQHQLLHCRDAAELQKIQAEFLQTTIDQYQAETGKLIEIGQKMFDATLKPNDTTQ